MGGRFGRLDQTHSACESTLAENYVIPSPKLSEDQKRKIFTANRHYFRPVFVVSFVLAGPFSSDHLELKSRWGMPKSRWGDAKY